MSKGMQKRTAPPPEQNALLQLLASGMQPNGDCLVGMLREAERQGVLALAYEKLDSDAIPEAVTAEVRKQIRGFDRLLYLTLEVSKRLTEAGIAHAVLKGLVYATCYPVPEYRGFGDVDILLWNREELPYAEQTLAKAGLLPKAVQDSNHHRVLHTARGLTVELHTELVEEFDAKEMKDRLETFQIREKEHAATTEVFGKQIPSLSVSGNLVHLMLHALQHFLLTGISLRFLTDWAVLLKNEVSPEDGAEYCAWMKYFGIKGFSDILSLACIRYLGVNSEGLEWLELPEASAMDETVEAFIREVMHCGTFGKMDASRVTAVRKRTLGGYIREFHHQMRRNHPRASKCCLLWPILWVVTLIVFLRNNRKVRKVSTFSVLQTAGERSRLIEKMQLWK